MTALAIAACLILAALVVLAVEVVERRQIRRRDELRKARRRELAGPPDWRNLVPFPYRLPAERPRPIMEQPALTEREAA